jgi:hypothetical protein
MNKKIRLIRTMIVEYEPDLNNYIGCKTIEEMAQLDASIDDRELLFEDCVSDEVKWEIIDEK